MIGHDIHWMREALVQAEQARQQGEVPVGAVIVHQNHLIATGYNLREKHQNAVFHAEMIAITQACQGLGQWRLQECTLYVTLEPCPMCMGAMINARIHRVVFGAYDAKAGCCGSVLNLLDFPFNHKVRCTGGVLESDCVSLLQQFFQQLRQRNHRNKQAKPMRP